MGLLMGQVAIDVWKDLLKWVYKSVMVCFQELPASLRVRLKEKQSHWEQSTCHRQC